MLRGEPTDPKSQIAGRGTGNSEAIELGSGQVKLSCMYRSGKYKEEHEKGYG